MDNTFSGNVVIHITQGLIEEISSDGSNLLVTVSYTECVECNRRSRQVRLVVSNRTIIWNEAGNRISGNDLKTGMIIDASFSSAMTRSIPPQATAYTIRVVSQPESENVTIGRIISVNRQNRSFTTVSPENQFSVIRFNVADDAKILNSFGRPMSFDNLVAGLRVRVRHAPFMTASIPPQTTAFEVHVIR